jgi:hypothetical protein
MLTLDRHIAVAALLVLLTGAGLAMCQNSARAQSGEHGDGHATNHDWYQYLKTPQGYSCCNGDATGGDCRPVQARPRDDGQWEAYFGGHWQSVPTERILPDRLNRVPLHAHICEQDGYVRCFLRGGGGT